MSFGEFFDVYNSFIVCFVLKKLLIYFIEGEGRLSLDKIVLIFRFFWVLFFERNELMLRIVNCFFKGYNVMFEFVVVGIKYYGFKKVL